MSRVFEALCKSEGNNKNTDLFSPESFFPEIESASDLTSVPAESAQIRPETRLVVWDSPHTLAADRFRRLRINLEKLQASGRLKTLLLTSPSPEDGKTTVTLNLATVLSSRAGCKVLLIEADLRCPSASRRLGLGKWEGLSACLTKGLDPIAAVRRIEPLGFYLMPAGELVANPTETLQSKQLTQLVQSLAGRFDWILIDSPPASPIADTLALKPQADACLVVARAAKTQREAIQETIRQFGSGFVLGVILNAVEGLERQHLEYYRDYYGTATMKAPPVAKKRTA